MFLPFKASLQRVKMVSCLFWNYYKYQGLDFLGFVGGFLETQRTIMVMQSHYTRLKPDLMALRAIN